MRASSPVFQPMSFLPSPESGVEPRTRCQINFRTLSPLALLGLPGVLCLASAFLSSPFSGPGPLLAKAQGVAELLQGAAAGQLHGILLSHVLGQLPSQVGH